MRDYSLQKATVQPYDSFIYEKNHYLRPVLQLFPAPVQLAAQLDPPYVHIKLQEPLQQPQLVRQIPADLPFRAGNHV